MKQLFLVNLVMLLKQLGEVYLPLQSLFNACQFYHLYESWGCSDFSMFSCRWGKTQRKSWWAILKTMSPSSLIIWKSRTEEYEKSLKEQNHCDYDMTGYSCLWKAEGSMQHEIQGNWPCFTISPTFDLTIQVIGTVNYASQTYLTADHLINVSSSIHFHLQDQKSAGTVWGMVF